MTRVSPPELARELPGPQASRSVTRAPRRTSSSAENPPKAPAPTTATWRDRRRAPRGFSRRPADSAPPAIAPRSARRERRSAGLLPMGLEPEVYTSAPELRKDRRHAERRLVPSGEPLPRGVRSCGELTHSLPARGLKIIFVDGDDEPSYPPATRTISLVSFPLVRIPACPPSGLLGAIRCYR